MRIAFYVIFGYAIVNFIYCVSRFPTHSKLEETASPSVIRTFSGHWMIFYAAGFGMLYSRIRAPQFYRDRTCPNGHSVGPMARFCPECGAEIPDSMGRSQFP
jgi:hypothetical protein